MSNRLIEIFEDEQLKSQKRIFDRIGRERYIKLPKPGTNPRGVEITKEALSSLVEDEMFKVRYRRKLCKIGRKAD